MQRHAANQATGKRGNLLRAGLVSHDAFVAHLANEPLCQDALHCGSHQIVWKSEIEQSGNCTDRVVRMEGAENQMTCHGRLHRDLGGLAIAHLAHHQDVGILAQDGTQR